MNRFFTTLLNSFFWGLVLVLLLPVSVHAQTPSYTPTTVNGQSISVLAQEVTIGVLEATSCLLTGQTPLPEHACLGVDPVSKQLGYTQQKGGMIGAMGGLIAMTYTPPASSTQFISYMSNNFGIVKPANAQVPDVGRIDCDPAKQGVGYCGLIPLLNVWKAFRNLAFFIFTVVFTLIGLGVMLRIKVDPHTVLTLENQIPKVIIGLILITFSFAIAGFLIDMMYVMIYVLFSFFAQPNLYPASWYPQMVKDIAKVQTDFQGHNPFQVFNDLVGIRIIVGDATGGAGDIVANLFYQPVETKSLWDFITGGIVPLIFNAFGALFSYIAMLAVFIVFAIAVLIALFRVWFALLYAYVYILFDVALAPLWIMAGVFPGSTVSFDAWIRDLLANLSAFPTVIGMFLFGKLFMYAFLEQAHPIWVAPLIGTPVRNSGDIQPISSLIAIAIVLMTPSVVDMMKEFFKAPTFKWSATAFQQIGAGAGIPGKGFQGGAQHIFGYGSSAGHGGPHGGSTWAPQGVGAALRAIGWIH